MNSIVTETLVFPRGTSIAMMRSVVAERITRYIGNQAQPRIAWVEDKVYTSKAEAERQLAQEPFAPYAGYDVNSTGAPSKEVQCKAVLYRNSAALMKNAQYKELVDKRTALIDSLFHYELEHDARRGVADYIGCKACGSKLRRNLLKGQVCPLCGGDLRSATAKIEIARRKAKINQLTQEMREINQAQAPLYWLIRFQYLSESDVTVQS